MILDRYRSEVGSNKRRAVRRVNDRIGARSESFAEEVCPDFVCECADERCLAVVSLTLAEWRAATCEAGYFVVCPGHEAAAEEVVVIGARYYLVRVGEWRDGGPVGESVPE